MAGSVADGAAEFEAKLASFVRENRLYGAVAGVVHGDQLAWSGGAGFADMAAGRPGRTFSTGSRPSRRPLPVRRSCSCATRASSTSTIRLSSGCPNLPTALPRRPSAASRSGACCRTSRGSSASRPALTSWPGSRATRGWRPATSSGSARSSLPCRRTPSSSDCNLGYQLLGEIVSRISETPYPQYVAEEILAPLGMASTAFEPLAPELASRCAVGYAGRSFSDELAIAPSMPPLWAEGGLWSTVSDLARWLSFQLAAHPGVTADSAQAESPVLAAASRREMHKPRYLSDEEWSSAWGISWYSARKDDVTWVQHSGGLPGFESNACFDRDSRVGAIVLVNGGADAANMAMSLAARARELAAAAAPQLTAPAPTPADLLPLLGVYASVDMSFLLRV